MTSISNKGHFDWLKPIAFAILICLAVTSLARLGYVLWLHDRVAATGGFAYILVQGFRFDLVTLGMLMALPMAITPLLAWTKRSYSVWRKFLHAYLLVVIGLLVFMEVATPPFITEYDVRPNYLFVEYLKYPKEVFSMLFVGYKMELLAGLIIVPLVLWSVNLVLRRLVKSSRPGYFWSALPLSFLGLLVCFAAARSTLDHRAVNPSTVAFSSDTLVNSLPLNSAYSTFYAIYEMRHEDSGYSYGNVTDADAVAAVRAALHLPESDFTDPEIPTLHFQQATATPDRPMNLVIILEESLGAEFVGSLGGLPLTPYLDKLADETMWFENLYATGTRSARGLEAVVAGFPPTTAESVLKLNRAQQNFFTFGEFLRRQGYDTSFIYGGEAQFDNMKRFFANNGFNKVIDKHDFTDATFTGSWGVSDEDVFRHADKVFRQYSATQPFFCLLFTTSNHSPWEFPDGRVELYQQPKANVNNAVKYADYAVGTFLEHARQSDYWKNTVFVVVADHNSRVYGADLVPIKRFHIPALIAGGSVKPQRVSRISSQIDLLPTAVSLIGISGMLPAPGLDVTRPDIDSIPGRAIMQYGDTQAYREGDRVVILRKQKPPELFHYADGEYSAMPQDQDMIDRAVRLAAWPGMAYRKLQYKLPPAK